MYIYLSNTSIPVFILHFFYSCCSVIKIIQKVKVLTHLTKYFATHEWKFHNDNVRQMWRSFSSADQQLFPFSFDNHNWDSYFKDYMLGIRQYVLKDNVSTAAKAKARIRKSVQYYCSINTCIHSNQNVNDKTLKDDYLANSIFRIIKA